MRWLRDYGAFFAATIAAVAAVANGWLQARRERRTSSERWLRELRLPRYVAFITAAADFDTAIFMEYGDWDSQEMGPPPKALHIAEAQEMFEKALAELVLIGPAAVATTAEAVQYSLWRFRNDLEESPWGSTPRYRKRALDAFYEEAARALGLTISVSEGPYGYRSWLKEQKELEAATAAAEDPD